MSRASSNLREVVRERAGNFCEYCLSFGDLTGHDFTVDHVLPKAMGGKDDLNNCVGVVFGATTSSRRAPRAVTHAPGERFRFFIRAKILGKIIFVGTEQAPVLLGELREGVQLSLCCNSIVPASFVPVVYGCVTDCIHLNKVHR